MMSSGESTIETHPEPMNRVMGTLVLDSVWVSCTWWAPMMYEAPGRMASNQPPR